MSPFDGAWLATAIAIMAPLLLVATGEVVSQKSGVLNVGLEGFMLTGAFFGMWVAVLMGGNPAIGMLASIVAGAGIATVMAVVVIGFRADQMVTGVGINLFALGLTGFLFEESTLNLNIPQTAPLEIPYLSDMPLIGKAFFGQHGTTYLVLLLVVAVWWVLFRTRLGIMIRACGDHPSAPDTAGHHVNRIRFFCVLFAGATAGAAGALLSVIYVGTFQDDMINGRGFLALAAVVLGRWHPIGVLMAVALFAGTDALQLRLQAQTSAPLSIWIVMCGIGVYLCLLGWNRRAKAKSAFGFLILLAGTALVVFQPDVAVPFQFWRALPFVLTLAVLFFVGSSRGEPVYLTRPFQRGG